MHARHNDRSLAPRCSHVPRSFTVYATLIAASAALAVGVLPLAHTWKIGSPARFWVLALCVLVAEFLPIPVPRRRGLDKVTISTAFAFAMLLAFGVGPAIAVYVISSIVADAVAGTAPIKIVFNAGQYALALVAAAAVLGAAPLPVSLSGGHLPLILAAGVALLLTNHVLAGTGAGLLARLPIPRYLREDLAFQTWLVQLGVRYLTSGSDVGYILSAGRADVRQQRAIPLKPA